MKIKENKKIILKKRVVLKNGFHATLEFFKTPDIYSIEALDKNNEMVGQLDFEIMKNFVCSLTKEERKAEAKLHKLPFSMVKKQAQLSIFESDLKMYNIHENVLMYDGEKYTLAKTSAILNLIEIKDRNFFQVGLGSAMHKEMESYARNANCDEIRLALYCPFGEFQDGTRAFYEHMGYIFENTSGMTTAFKPLPKETLEMENKTSAGTPIREKYFQKKEK